MLCAGCPFRWDTGLDPGLASLSTQWNYPYQSIRLQSWNFQREIRALFTGFPKHLLSWEHLNNSMLSLFTTKHLNVRREDFLDSVQF